MPASQGHLGRARTTTATLFVLLVAACGSSSPASRPTESVTPSTLPEASPSSITTTDPGDPTLLSVPMDIPFPQAPLAVQNEWRQYYATGAITVVPNTSVPFARPATPRVVDATNGAVDAATASLWGDALMRENAWENWAIIALQLGLFDDSVVSASRAEPGLVLPQGATGFRITGMRWPASLRLVPLSRISQTFLGVSDAYAFTFSFTHPWSVDAVFPNGTTQPIADQTASAGTTVVAAGKVVSLPDLGEIWYADASYVCNSSEPQPVLTICAE